MKDRPLWVLLVNAVRSFKGFSLLGSASRYNQVDQVRSALDFAGFLSYSVSETLVLRYYLILRVVM